MTDQPSSRRSPDAINQELNARMQKIEFENLRLKNFVYRVGHDLNAPLRHLEMFTSLLMQEEKCLSESGGEILMKIKGSTDWTKKLLNSLILFAEVKSGPVVKKSTSIAELVRQVIDFSTIKNDQISVNLNFKEDINIFCEPSLMSLVLQNLIGNSIKFKKENNKCLIDIYVDVDKEHTNLRIKDNGIGFNSKNVKQQFQIFQRFHEKHKFGGTGLGLYLCQEIVEDHGGKITISSIVDSGTEVSIRLPNMV